MNSYVKVDWFHEIPNMPVAIYSEIDGDRWETRKVEFFRDGSATYAGPNISSGNSFLAEVPFPSLEEISSDSQFRAQEISSSEFEKIWIEITHA